ncbi:MAG: hypothetical protein V1789_04975 [PVC group bacterium]
MRRAVLLRIVPCPLVLLCLSALSCPPASVASPSGHRIFHDDFSGEPEQKWHFFARPGPRINARHGNPAPALDTGAAGEKNGLLSKRVFHLSPGMVVRCDLFISGRSGSVCFGGSFGFPRNPDAFLQGVWPDWLVGMSYDYLGHLGWTGGIIPEGGTLTCCLVDEDGDLEISRRPYRDHYLGGWHTYEILVTDSGFVEFRIDGDLVYYSRKRLTYGRSHLPLLLGHHSGRTGTVYHDNLEVLTYSDVNELEK